MTQGEQPPISDYALISDCRCTALISREASVDWCCLPRLDSDSVFGRLLDWQNGGCWSISPLAPGFRSERRYLQDTLVLETTFICNSGKARVLDFFALSSSAEDGQGKGSGEGLQVRMVEGCEGEVELALRLAPRLDYGAITPFIHKHSRQFCLAWGSDEGLIIYSDLELQPEDGAIDQRFTVRAGERIRFSLRHVPPAELDDPQLQLSDTPQELDERLHTTIAWWRDWSGRCKTRYRHDEQTMQSARTLKALTFEASGAIAAAATTSLPEWIGGERNWDYRYSWIRDSVFTVRALHQLGYQREADRFAQFIERSAAGSAEQLQIMFGIDGKRRIPEIELDWLAGYHNSRPVRIGNDAAEQSQLDAFGELLQLAWLRHCHGSELTERQWCFLREVVDVAARRWREPDCGIWEVRNGPWHFVFSKAMCWCALDRGIALARHYRMEAPLEEWERSRAEVEEVIFEQGYDSKRGIFRQAFGNEHLDASLLLLPWFGFVAYDDPRMVRTVDAICEQLSDGGLLLRYDSPDGLRGKEGVFLACTFWLVDCLAKQGRYEQAWHYYNKAAKTANDLGLFAEEVDPEQHRLLGNFPQGLSHVSQIVARLALDQQQSSPRD